MKNERIDYLDSMRGLAALMVFNNHFIYQYNLQKSSNQPAFYLLSFFSNAGASVSFFFVLSALVLSRKYIHSSMHIGGFLVSRTIRIYIPYLIAMMLSFIAYLLFFNESYVMLNRDLNIDRLYWNESHLGDIYKQVNLLRLSGGAGLVPQRWTLIVEL